MRITSALAFLPALLVVAPAIAQTTGGTPYPDAVQSTQPPQPSQRPGETAQSAVGQVGLRQSQGQLARELNTKPMARLENRIQNRIEARVRNRIDRYYDPKANATSPFSIAGEQLRKTGRPN